MEIRKLTVAVSCLFLAFNRDIKSCFCPNTGNTIKTFNITLNAFVISYDRSIIFCSTMSEFMHVATGLSTPHEGPIRSRRK